MAWKIGSYIGTGVKDGINDTSRTVQIPGVTWTPKVVLIGNVGGGVLPGWHSADMGINRLQLFGGGISASFAVSSTFAAGVFRVTATGSLNIVGTPYFYAACDSTNCVTGKFTGDGVGQTISGVGFQPGFVLIGNGYSRGPSGCMKFPTLAATLPFDTGAPFAGIEITPDGFVVGADARLNGAGNTIYWAAFRITEGETEGFSYQGDGLDFHILTPGFDPQLVLIKAGADSGAKASVEAMWRGGPPLIWTSYLLSEGMLTGTVYPNRIYGPDAQNNYNLGGFSVGKIGAEVNVAAFQYHCFLIRDSVQGKLHTPQTATAQGSVA